MFQENVQGEVLRLEKEFDCKIGLSFQEPDHLLSAAWRADEMFHPASTIKVPVMIETFRQADEGRFSINDEIRIDPWFESMLDGSRYETDSHKLLAANLGGTLPLLTVVEQMIVVSDNLATNLLIERCGTRRITATMRALGAKDGFVVRCLQDEAAFQAGLSNKLTPRDLTTLFEAIETDRAASPAACAEMRRILLAQEFNDMIPARLPEGVRVGHKTGSITAHSHDAGIVYPPGGGRYYLAIMTSGIQDGKKASDMVAGLSRFIYDERESLLTAGTRD